MISVRDYLKRELTTLRKYYLNMFGAIKWSKNRKGISWFTLSHIIMGAIMILHMMIVKEWWEHPIEFHNPVTNQPMTRAANVGTILFFYLIAQAQILNSAVKDRNAVVRSWIAKYKDRQDEWTEEDRLLTNKFIKS